MKIKFLILICIFSLFSSITYAGERLAIQLGELDVITKEYNNVDKNKVKWFDYTYNKEAGMIIVKQLDKGLTQTNNIEFFYEAGPCEDFKNRPCTLYFSPKNAIKVVNGDLNGEHMMYFTSRDWITKKIGWKSLYFEFTPNLVNWIRANQSN